jgi:hypothetical protein
LAERFGALAGKSSHAAAKAAQIAGEFEISVLALDLVAAFERFMVNPVKSDPSCWAKAAIISATASTRAPRPGSRSWLQRRRGQTHCVTRLRRKLNAPAGTAVGVGREPA